MILTYNNIIATVTIGSINAEINNVLVTGSGLKYMVQEIYVVRPGAGAKSS